MIPDADLRGDTVLEPGRNRGEIAFITPPRVVGAKGGAIEVDINEETLALAHSADPKVAECGATRTANLAVDGSIADRGAVP